MRYEVDSETFAIKIYNDGDDVPFQFQPDYPNGDKFDSIDEASAWAELSIAAHLPECLIYAPKAHPVIVIDDGIEPSVQVIASVLRAVLLVP